MSALTVGELFAGYGGAALAVEQVWPRATVRWVSEVCKFVQDGNAGHYSPHRAPCSLLAHRFPDAPNLGDITKIDWTTVEPVDIITGGSPCQDLSHAGKRVGMKDGTRSGLWASMCNAIDILRPSLVIWENVRGAYSAEADSGMEPCQGCVGDEPNGADGPVLRALGRVLGDLADIGYDACWTGLRAADIGACHGRFRVFVLAWPADAESVGREWARGSRTGWGGFEDDDRGRGGTPLVPTPRASDADHAGPNQRGSKGDLTVASVVAQLPAPRATRGGSTTETVALLPSPKATNNENRQTRSDTFHAGPNLGEALALLPTPAVNDMGAGKEPDAWDAWDAWTDDMRDKHGNGNGHGKSLEIEAKRLPLLPSPQTSDTNGAGDKPGEWADRWQLRDIVLDKVRAVWGDYAPAILRAEHALGRPAPAPTLPTGRDGKMQLSPRFEEWMMMLPDGWVTDPAMWEGVKGARNQQVKMLGNGIVPAQMAEAIRRCLTIREALA